MRILRPILLSLTFYSIIGHTQAQQSDTFFLARKKGLLGKLGRSISTNEIVDPVKTVNPFLRFAGKRIKSIEIANLGLNQNMGDTAEVKKGFFLELADAFHKNTREPVIRKHLFFKEGDVLIPFLLSDNERFLREQEFFRDALIVVLPEVNNNDEVNVVVVTRDVFSIGGTQRISSLDKFSAEIREENFNGKAIRIAVNGLYDTDRSPHTGFGGEVLFRNLAGKFINWKLGFKNYNEAFNSAREEENRFYTSFEKPMVSRYTAFTGAIDADYNSSKNRYLTDSLFKQDFRYQLLRLDAWGGVNISSRRKWLQDTEGRFRHFVGLRTFYQHFYSQPEKFEGEYNYNYADINGVLLSYSIFRQNFYKTNFIYGFGRNEDIPAGINATLTGGWTNKNGRKRNYYGLSGEYTAFSEKGRYFAYTLRTGGFSYNNKLEDIDLLASVDHFTSLKKLGPMWRSRYFFSAGITRQFRTELNSPLFVESEFGLPYFPNGFSEGDIRGTFRSEAVFFHMKKFIGFGFAPFVFGDITVLRSIQPEMSGYKNYPVIGGGFRTRNENLVFGTIEVRGYYFPKTTLPEMKHWRVDLSTRVRFKYNSTFIRRPDFVVSN